MRDATEGRLVVKSIGIPLLGRRRVFHLKFGNGNVIMVDGNKLTIQFDKRARIGWWIVLWSGLAERESTRYPISDSL